MVIKSLSVAHISIVSPSLVINVLGKDVDIHIFIDWFILPFRHIRYTTRFRASTCLWVVVVQLDGR